MSLRAATVRARRLLVVSLVVLSILVLVLPGAPATAERGDAVASAPRGPTDAAPLVAPQAQPIPAQNGTWHLYWNLTTAWVNGSIAPTGWVIGPAPANVSMTVQMSSAYGTWTCSMDWGDGSAPVNFTVAVSPTGTGSTTLNHSFNLVAVYSLYLQANASTPLGSYWTSQTLPLELFGPAGPNPIHVTTNVTNGTVPVDVNYTATIAGAPANATASWEVYLPDGSTLRFSESALNLTQSTFDARLTVPGYATGLLRVYYPGSSLVYDAVLLPWVTVGPTVSINVTHTSTAGPSPWNVTFWANATNLSGGAYVGNATPVWTFNDNFSNYGNPWFWGVGPTVGSPIWRDYFLNGSGGVGFGALVSFVTPDNITLGSNWTELQFASVTGGGGSSLLLSASPNNGTAPLFFNLSASLSSYNSSAAFDLELGADLGGVGLVWNTSVDIWTGAPVLIPGNFTTPGTYFVWANVFDRASGAWVAGANLTIVVWASASPVSVSFSAAAPDPAAPGNFTLSLVAGGGAAPYNLSLCTEGPFALPNGTGPCTPAGAVAGWNGTSLAMEVDVNATGNYTIVATAHDSLGATSTASASVYVGPAAPAAPLSVHASFVAPATLTSEGAAYGFTAAISGGVAPYNVQWSFGDGASGSALPGSTIVHSYVVSGTYLAMLTVTDARGFRATSTVGPLVVTLPVAPALPVPWWASVPALALAALVGVVALVVLAWTLRRLSQRSDALNWFRELEEPGGADGPDSEPR